MGRTRSEIRDTGPADEARGTLQRKFPSAWGSPTVEFSMGWQTSDAAYWGNRMFARNFVISRFRDFAIENQDHEITTRKPGRGRPAPRCSTRTTSFSSRTSHSAHRAAYGLRWSFDRLIQS